MQVVEKGILFKQANSKGTDLRIPWDNLISAKRITDKDSRGQEISKLSIILLENYELIVSFIVPIQNRYIVMSSLADYVSDIINERACGVDEEGWGLGNETKIESREPEQTSFSGADELDKWFSLYERGAISKEEYEAKKKQLLGL